MIMLRRPQQHVLRKIRGLRGGSLGEEAEKGTLGWREQVGNQSHAKGCGILKPHKMAEWLKKNGGRYG